MTIPKNRIDVVVMGDELESILTAVSAARMGISVGLVRTAEGGLGGLSTRGGLSYMDITLEHRSPLFREFLHRADVQRVALDPNKAHQALEEMLTEAGVPWITDPDPQVETDTQGTPHALRLTNQQTFPFRYLLDTTPDGDVARTLGVPYTIGLGGLFPHGSNFLGVSPAFILKGIEAIELADFECHLRDRPDLGDLLAQALPHHPADLRDEYLTRQPICPDDEDYLDILNPTLGVLYHLWRHGEAVTYPKAAIWIDGGNIARLPEGRLGFNGMVTRIDDLDMLLAYSHGAAIPQTLLEEMAAFERFLREVGGFIHAKVIPPESLYVRQTINLQSRKILTGSRMMAGGVLEEDAIGLYSYWVDFRGINGWEVCSASPDSPEIPLDPSSVDPSPIRWPLPKPVFRVGLDVALPQEPRLKNFAFVSRSAGYSPVAQGVCRIVQHNALLGEGIGIATALACEKDRAIADIPASAVQEVIQSRTTALISPLKGNTPPLKAQVFQATSSLLTRDSQIADRCLARHPEEDGVMWG